MNMTAEIANALHLLGLKPGASLKECRQAWHELSKRCHPDTQAPGSAQHEQALEKQRQLNAAYELLKKSDIDKFSQPDYRAGCAEMPAVPADQQYQAGRSAEDAGDLLGALHIFESLAHLGHAKAQFRLGYLYCDSVMKDIKQTLYWWKRAADQGHVLSQYNLGLMYERGLAVPLDVQQAAFWFAAAAKAGDAKAKQKLRTLQAASALAAVPAARIAEPVPPQAGTGTQAQSMCGPSSESAGRAFIGRKNRAS